MSNNDDVDENNGERRSFTSKNLILQGRRTSVRLEPPLCDALEDIAREEGLTPNQLCNMIDESSGDIGLTAAIRMTIVVYLHLKAFPNSEKFDEKKTKRNKKRGAAEERDEAKAGSLAGNEQQDDAKAEDNPVAQARDSSEGSGKPAKKRGRPKKNALKKKKGYPSIDTAPRVKRSVSLIHDEENKDPELKRA